jgi:hypothetical protein
VFVPSVSDRAKRFPSNMNGRLAELCTAGHWSEVNALLKNEDSKITGKQLNRASRCSPLPQVSRLTIS